VTKSVLISLLHVHVSLEIKYRPMLQNFVVMFSVNYTFETLKSQSYSWL